MITNPRARYAGARSVSELVPAEDAHLAETHFETWLMQAAAKTAAVAH
jgi:hypothetical protein